MKVTNYGLFVIGYVAAMLLGLIHPSAQVIGGAVFGIVLVILYERHERDYADVPQRRSR